MTRTVADYREILKKKAKWIKTQEHFDQVMSLFPEELRLEIYAEIQPLLTRPLSLTVKP